MTFTLQAGEQTLPIRQPHCSGITYFAYWHATSPSTFYHPELCDVTAVLPTARSAHHPHLVHEEVPGWKMYIADGPQGCCPLPTSMCQSYSSTVSTALIST